MTHEAAFSERDFHSRGKLLRIHMEAGLGNDPSPLTSVSRTTIFMSSVAK